MTPPEIPVVIKAHGCEMLGIVSPPDPSVAGEVGAILVVGGAQCRAGSHRQSVTLARQLANAGLPCLRFDLPGLGDSPGTPYAFEDTAPQLCAAIDALFHHQPDLKRVALWGLCDGASAALLFVQKQLDARVAGLALLNPWMRSEASLARTQVKHYYWNRLKDVHFWRKLIRGHVGWEAPIELWRTLLSTRSSTEGPASMGYQDRMAQAWHQFPGAILVLLSDRDLTALAFKEHADSDLAWKGWRNRRGLQCMTLVDADHTCSSRATTLAMERAVVDWARNLLVTNR